MLPEHVYEQGKFYKCKDCDTIIGWLTDEYVPPPHNCIKCTECWGVDLCYCEAMETLFDEEVQCAEGI